MPIQSSLKFARDVADPLTGLSCPEEVGCRYEPSSCLKRYRIGFLGRNLRFRNLNPRIHGFALD
jgi:hypothetical protein